jgi:hypothetical protein
MYNDYINAIDNVVAVGINGLSNFYDLTNKVCAVNPVELVCSLERLHQNGAIDEHTYQKLINSASACPPVEEQNHLKTLPIPHQVDYDWRFSEIGKKYFMEFIRDNFLEKSKITRIAFIGSPTLFRYYCNNDIENLEIYLIDFNAEKHISKFILPSNAHVVNCNINYDWNSDLELDKIQAEIIIIDPPWYPEYYKKFFELSDVIGCSQCTVIGAFPPLLTRESISAERYEIDLYVKGLGFDRLQYEPLCIEYYSPPFEKNVFHTNNIFNFSVFWRRGDFFFTHRNNRAINNNEKIIIRNGAWVERDIGIVRFKLRQSIITEDKNFNIELESLYKNNIYPSVSRRFKGHDKINVWTSGNRVFYCSNIPSLFIILEHLSEDNILQLIEQEYGEIIPDIEKIQIKKVQESIRLLVEMELKEYGDWCE